MALIYSSMTDVEAMYAVAEDEDIPTLDRLLLRTGRRWKCSTCDNINSTSDPVCESCFHTRGPEDS